MIKQTLEAAGITVTEFAAICGVSRATASSWVNEHSTPHHLHAARIDEILKSIRRAVRVGRLPVQTSSLRDKQRRKELRAALPELTF